MGLESLYLSSQGRISRKVFWAASLPLVPIAIVLELILRGEPTLEAAFLALVLFVVVLVPNIMLSIKRYHDRGKTGWFVLVYLIPVIGPIWQLVELGFLRGTAGPNRFGPDPMAARRGVATAS